MKPNMKPLWFDFLHHFLWRVNHKVAAAGDVLPNESEFRSYARQCDPS